MPTGWWTGTADPWVPWNIIYTTTNTTTMTVLGDPWQTWATSATASTTAASHIWGRWQLTYATTYATTSAIQVHSMDDLARLSGRVPRPQRTEDEWAAIRAENERQRVERDRLQVAARDRARELLALVLTSEQMADYTRAGYFDVVGSEGGLFRVKHGTSGNISQLLNGLEVNRLCVHPKLWDDEGGYLPTEDCLAAQALALMHDELGAVNTANVHAGVRHLRAA